MASRHAPYKIDKDSEVFHLLESIRSKKAATQTKAAPKSKQGKSGAKKRKKQAEKLFEVQVQTMRNNHASKIINRAMKNYLARKREMENIERGGEAERRK